MCCADIANETATCQGTCAPADTVQCLGSADCPGTAATDGGACCATAVLQDEPDGSDGVPHCQVNSITSYCAGACPSAITLTCQSTPKTGTDSVEKLQVCAQTADCAHASSGATACCPVLSYHVCLAPAVATLENITCM